tara:strand:- start:14274 stop:15851 length:1578 start_codon:yes stop_codon:yes gene_type:complete
MLKLFYNLSIYTKLTLALFSTVLMVSLALLLFLQSSVNSFDSYLQNIDALLMQEVVKELETHYAEDADEGSWDFLNGDLALWIAQQRRNLRGIEFPQRGGDLTQNILPGFREPPENGLPTRFPSDFNTNGQIRPPEQSFEARLTLRNPAGDIVMGNTQAVEPEQILPLYHEGELIGQLELLPFDKEGRRPTPGGQGFGAPPDLGFFALTGYGSDPDSRDRFLTGQTRIFIALMLISITVILLLGLPLASYFNRRIKHLYNGATLLSQGDYSHRIKVDGQDELARLSTTFNYLAEVLQKNRDSQQVWMSNISHELRTPLGLLKGELEAIQDGIRKPGKDEIAMLHNEVEQINRLVNDLFVLSLSDLGALDYHKEKVDVGDILKEAVTAFKEIARQHSLNLHLDIAALGSVSIFADRQRLLQLLFNLIQNSTKYTAKGGEIAIKGSCTNKVVSISISDSAPDVTEAQLPRLFERLYRVEQSRNRTTGGAGLGLAICKTIVESHHGTIEAKPADLGGISIIITLPIQS